MSVKLFKFAVSDLRLKQRAGFVVESEKLGGAFALGVVTLPVVFGDKQPGLRMFRFDFENGRTGEHSGFIGQGLTALEGWADAVKMSREAFRPKNDGKLRPSVGIPVFLPPRAGDVHAVNRTVSRSIESFESDENFDQERMRLARAAEAKRLAASEGRAA